MPECCVLYGPELGAYAFDDPHPFGRKRLPAFWSEFCGRGLERRVAIEEPESTDEMALFHDPEYVRRVEEASKLGRGYLDRGDTPAFPGVFEAARLVAGTTLKAVRLVMEGRYRRAFCPIAGLHHARRNRAGGFCVFNDVGMAIERLRAAHGVRRVGYVDIDAHHGDGVYYGFEADPEVFIADAHEDGQFLYPGTGWAYETGRGAAAGTKLNLPMSPGAGEAEFERAWEKIEAFIDAARPEIILLQCGADSIAGDPLAHLEFSPAGHRRAAERLRALADRHASGRMIAMGGGGYDPQTLASTWCGVVEAMA